MDERIIIALIQAFNLCVHREDFRTISDEDIKNISDAVNAEELTYDSLCDVMLEAVTFDSH